MFELSADADLVNHVLVIYGWGDLWRGLWYLTATQTSCKTELQDLERSSSSFSPDSLQSKTTQSTSLCEDEMVNAKKEPLSNTICRFVRSERSIEFTKGGPQ